ncbi:MAG TPA: hypothetical protein VMU04_03965 [Candidatus Acidoferrum sp.]|nr:hypothetical protein [Candidatus Acidoferrum sp.]
MISLAGGMPRTVLWLAALALWTGCRTPKESDLFTTSGPGWRVQEGQALWRPRRSMPELAGDVVMASNSDGRCVVQFTKTPLSVLLAQTSRTNWLIEFPPQHLGFMGRGEPSKRFAWLHLYAALQGDTLPRGYEFHRKPDGGWRLENKGSGESVEGFLGP